MGTAQDCRKLFINPLQKKHKLKADIDSVTTFWKQPKEPLPLETWPDNMLSSFDATVMFDGRYWSNGDLTTAPPLPIFHPIFELFIRLLGDPKLRPTCQDITTAQKIILSSETDGVITMSYRFIHAHLLITELKRELVERDSGLSVQAALRMRALWHDEKVKAIRNGCYCPILILAGGGPWLAVLSDVYTDRFIVQRLMDMIWIGYASTHQEIRVMQLARIFVALRQCVQRLENYYKHIADLMSEIPVINIKNPHPHPRFYPYPSSFAENGKTINFKYVRVLVDYPSCDAFQAKTQSDNPEDIVVKFITEYGKEVHVFLAELGHAPRLWFYGPLPGKRSILSDSLEKATGPTSTAGDENGGNGLYREEGEEPKIFVACQQISDVLVKLHDEGFVLGGLRRQLSGGPINYY
ncbi:hypothetical protein AX17_002215 [Amanita inopinata Kibby_2008]|nr:hypothetical protein AX17_002215 [Amanita inopinata Kibby_2008]